MKNNETSSAVHGIPKCFWHGDDQPVADDVAELIKVLSQLPPTLKFDEPVTVTVYNVKTNPSLAIEAN